MILNILTSENTLNTITDFQYICDLAKCSKCKSFIVLKSTNKLYGASDDCASIHEIDIPFLVNTDLEFRIDNVDKSIIGSNDSYFVPHKFPWVILSSYYWEMYSGGDIYTDYDEETGRYELYDKTTSKKIDQIHMYKTRMQYDFERINLISQLEGFFNRAYTLSNPVEFSNMQNHPGIRKAYDSKSAMGRFLCIFDDPSTMTKVGVYFYKGLFSLSKSDVLNLDVRFDIFNTNRFMISYKPIKKKNPLTFNRYGVPFREKIHCMYVNIV